MTTPKTRPSKTRTRKGKRKYTDEEIAGQAVVGTIDWLIKSLGIIKLKTILHWIERLNIRELVVKNPNITLGDLGKQISDLDLNIVKALLDELAARDPEAYTAFMEKVYSSKSQGK